MKLFFFFGSLRTGYWNNSRTIFEGSYKVGDAVTVRPFKMYLREGGTIPTVCPDPKGMSVHGELWSLTPQDQRRVFVLETGYDHGEFEVKTEGGVVSVATIFHHSSPEDCGYVGRNFEEVVSGDYTQEVSTKGNRIS